MNSIFGKLAAIQFHIDGLHEDGLPIPAASSVVEYLILRRNCSETITNQTSSISIPFLVPNMTNRYLTEARGLFEQAEGETAPSRKFAALEKAFELIDLAQGDLSAPPSDQELAENMRHSNIRRLLGQLVEMRAIQFDDWFDYIQLLLMQNDVKTVLEEYPSLKAGYQDFVAIWRDELIEMLGRD